MALVTIGAGVSSDLEYGQVFYGSVVTATSTLIEIDAGTAVTDYSGQDFTYSGDAVTGGTLTGVSEYSNGSLFASATGLNVPAAVAYQYIEQNQLYQLFALGLSGNDTIVGSGAHDVLDGFGGNDTIIGQPGGFDTAAFAGPASSYSIVENPQGFVVSGPDGVDQLISIKSARFDDQTISLVPPDFDVAYYLSHNPDVQAAGVDPVAHFAFEGWKEGRDPNAFFDVRYYLNQNPDVAAAGIDPLTHYEQSGWKEGRDPSSTFSTTAYLQANPDVAAAHIDPLMHYLASGAAEGRMAFIATPHGIGPQNPLVDDNYYFSQYADVRAVGVDPTAHYEASGWKEGRNPDALFDTKFYLQHNPDVAAAGVDPLLHYEANGWLEGRDPSAQFSTSEYLSAYPDVRASGIDPLVHYEQFGAGEGRAIFHE